MTFFSNIVNGQFYVISCKCFGEISGSIVTIKIVKFQMWILLYSNGILLLSNNKVLGKKKQVTKGHINNSVFYSCRKCFVSWILSVICRWCQWHDKNKKKLTKFSFFMDLFLFFIEFFISIIFRSTAFRCSAWECRSVTWSESPHFEW